LNGIGKTYRNVFDYYDYAVRSNDSIVSKKTFVNEYNGGYYYLPDNILNPKFASTAVNTGHTGIKRFSSIEESDGIFTVLLFCFILLVYILRKGGSFFKESTRSVFSIKESDTTLFHNETIREFWADVLLVFETVFLYAITVFVFLLESDSINYPQHFFIKVISFAILILFFELPRFLFFKLSGYLFNLKNVILSYQKVYLITNEMLGIVAFIPVLLLIYFDYYHNVLFILLLFLFVISRLIIIYNVIVFFFNKKVNVLYLIAYLCSLEIIPYILLYNGLVYLYNIDYSKFIIWH